jgi:hypothetical protein
MFGLSKIANSEGEEGGAMYFEIDKLVRENKEHNMFKSELHRFAKEVLRPAAETSRLKCQPPVGSSFAGGTAH